MLGLVEVTAGGVGIIIGAGIYVLLSAATRAELVQEGGASDRTPTRPMAYRDSPWPRSPRSAI